MKRILIVEDNEAIAKLIRLYVDMSGYESIIAYDGETALQILKEEKIHLILLDLMLPVYDGEYLLQHIRDLNIATIVVSAKSSLIDRVNLLKLGADDYIVKPFESAELIARIEAVLRRYYQENNKIYFKNIKVEEEKHLVTLEGKNIKLSLKEYELLVYFLKNRNKILSKEELQHTIWKNEKIVETRTIDVHIQKIRKKLNLVDDIKTITKVGYILQDISDKNVL